MPKYVLKPERTKTASKNFREYAERLSLDMTFQLKKLAAATVETCIVYSQGRPIRIELASDTELYMENSGSSNRQLNTYFSDIRSMGIKMERKR
ncbi:hypothetical protein A3A99_03865 [Candidatus Nomurabacteria bacterium RIFCSPLOWO2_01_FULL_41_18]|nr:MAG: hypothetical protein A3A99_03865 [Candidatus Nomurabacteria bacterium RIFCSPLOWO2_01_FULL_41_18]